MENLKNIEEMLFEDIQSYANAVDDFQTALNKRTQLWSDRKHNAINAKENLNKSVTILISAGIVLAALIGTVIIYIARG